MMFILFLLYEVVTFCDISKYLPSRFSDDKDLPGLF